jgi:hypothetical protein
MKTFISIIDTQKQTNDVNQLTSDLFYKLKREKSQIHLLVYSNQLSIKP